MKFNYTFKLTIEYDGTRYHGWQEQINARTIAGEIRAIASEILNEKVDLGGAGRTDGGVHALAQVAHLRTNKNPKPVDLLRAINSQLPADINLLRVDPAPLNFHARHDAIARYYLYQIATERTAFGKKYVWWIKDRLDLHRMRRAAEHFHGFHNFATFSEQDEPRPAPKPSNRHTSKSDSTMVDVHHLAFEGTHRMVYFRIGASHYLWKMVRRIVGTLVQVGLGNLNEQEIPDLLRTPSPKIAEWTAPASGLFLERVEYPNEERFKLSGSPRLGISKG